MSPSRRDRSRPDISLSLHPLRLCPIKLKTTQDSGRPEEPKVTSLLPTQDSRALSTADVVEVKALQGFQNWGTQSLILASYPCDVYDDTVHTWGPGAHSRGSHEYRARSIGHVGISRASDVAAHSSEHPCLMSSLGKTFPGWMYFE